MPNMTKEALQQIQSLHDQGFVSAEEVARAKGAAAIDGDKVLRGAVYEAFKVFEAVLKSDDLHPKRLQDAAYSLRSTLEDIDAARQATLQVVRK